MKKLLLFSLIILLTFTACVPKKLSQQELAQISTQDYKLSKEKVFRGALQFLAQNQYIVQTSDLESGIITATRNMAVDPNLQAMERVLAGSNTMASAQFQVTISIMALSPTSSLARLNITLNVYNSAGGLTSSEPHQKKQDYLDTFYNIGFLASRIN